MPELTLPCAVPTWVVEHVRIIGSGIEKSHLNVNPDDTSFCCPPPKVSFLFCALANPTDSLGWRPLILELQYIFSLVCRVQIDIADKTAVCFKRKQTKKQVSFSHPFNRKHIYKMPSHPRSVGYHLDGGRWLQAGVVGFPVAPFCF